MFKKSKRHVVLEVKVNHKYNHRRDQVLSPKSYSEVKIRVYLGKR